MTQTKAARAIALGESPAELKHVVYSMARKLNAEPWRVWTLPDLSVTDGRATLVHSSIHLRRDGECNRQVHQ